MSTNTKFKNNDDLGTVAVDGILVGFSGGVVMLLFLLATALLTGQTAGELLTLFDPAQNNNWITGLLGHLAVSSIYGLLYAVTVGWLFSRWLRANAADWLMGLGYGLLLALLAFTWLLPATNSPLLTIPTVTFVSAHALYGIVVGYRFRHL